MLIPIKRYAELHNTSAQTIMRQIKEGKLVTGQQRAENGRWLIDDGEPFKGKIRRERRKSIPEGFIRLDEYALMMNYSYSKAVQIAQQSPVARKVGGVWWINPQLPSPEVPVGFVTIEQYAEMYGYHTAHVSMKCRNGELKSAIKVNRRWYIESTDQWDNQRKKFDDWKKDTSELDRSPTNRQK